MLTTKFYTKIFCKMVNNHRILFKIMHTILHKIIEPLNHTILANSTRNIEFYPLCVISFYSISTTQDQPNLPTKSETFRERH